MGWDEGPATRWSNEWRRSIWWWMGSSISDCQNEKFVRWAFLEEILILTEMNWGWGGGEFRQRCYQVKSQLKHELLEKFATLGYFFFACQYKFMIHIPIGLFPYYIFKIISSSSTPKTAETRLKLTKREICLNWFNFSPASLLWLSLFPLKRYSRGFSQFAVQEYSAL